MNEYLPMETSDAHHAGTRGSWDPQGCSSQPPQKQSAEEGPAESILTLPASHPGGQDGREPHRGPCPSPRRDESSPRLCREPGVPGRGSAVFIRSQDFEIPVQTSQSSPGPGPALSGGCALPRGARSPRTLAHSAHSAAAPAAAGRPWGFHHTPAADAKLGREGSSERGNTEGGDACLWWFRDLPGGPVATIPCAQCRGPGFDPWSGN